jgi:hypothetical protein
MEGAVIPAFLTVIPAKAGVSFFVIPAKAGIQYNSFIKMHFTKLRCWIPAFAGMT